LQSYVNARKLRRLEIVPKLQRGGRVSSLNQGLALASGEIVLPLHGDTSLFNDMVRYALRHSSAQNVCAVAGNLRSRNARLSAVTLRGFLKQRLRWDGDLSYLYLRKYRHHLRPGLMGLRNFLALVWTGLLFQLALPFVLLTYTIYMLFVYPAAVTLGVLAFVYLFYTLLAALMYVEYWFLYSERRRQDLK